MRLLSWLTSALIGVSCPERDPYGWPCYRIEHHYGRHVNYFNGHAWKQSTRRCR